MSGTVVPIAVRIGFTHVSVAQLSSGRWHAVIWSRKDGPTPLEGSGLYGDAVAQAERYAAKREGVVLDLPDEVRSIDILRSDDGGFLVQQMSAGMGSAALLAEFGPHERDQAVRYAVARLPQYAPCKLGRVDP